MLRREPVELVNCASWLHHLLPTHFSSLHWILPINGGGFSSFLGLLVLRYYTFYSLHQHSSWVQSIQTVCLFALVPSASLFYIFSTGARRTIRIWASSQARCNRSWVLWCDCDGTVLPLVELPAAVRSHNEWEAAFHWTLFSLFLRRWKKIASDFCFLSKSSIQLEDKLLISSHDTTK